MIGSLTSARKTQTCRSSRPPLDSPRTPSVRQFVDWFEETSTGKKTHKVLQFTPQRTRVSGQLFLQKSGHLSHRSVSSTSLVLFFRRSTCDVSSRLGAVSRRRGAATHGPGPSDPYSCAKQMLLWGNTVIHSLKPSWRVAVPTCFSRRMMNGLPLHQVQSS